MMRIATNTKFISMALFVAILVPNTGCQSGGMQLPSLAFWKKDSSQWAKSDSVPPPATHFDPEPSTGGFTNDGAAGELVIDNGTNSLPSIQPITTPPTSKQLVDNDKGKPLRQPYQFDASENLNPQSPDNGFQPGGQISQSLPDFGSSMGTGFAAAPTTPPTNSFPPTNSLPPSNSLPTSNEFGGSTANGLALAPSISASTPGNRNNPPVDAIPSNGFKLSPATPSASSSLTGSQMAQGSLQNRYPGLSNQAKKNSSLAPDSLTRNAIGALAQSPLTPNTRTFDPGNISTPSRQLIPPTTATQPGSPNNQLRPAPLAGDNSGYPATKHSAFGAPAKPTGIAGTQNNTQFQLTPNSTTGPGAGKPGQDVILPPSLRHANLDYAPGSINQNSSVFR